MKSTVSGFLNRDYYTPNDSVPLVRVRFCVCGGGGLSGGPRLVIRDMTSSIVCKRDRPTNTTYLFYRFLSFMTMKIWECLLPRDLVLMYISTYLYFY